MKDCKNNHFKPLKIRKLKEREDLKTERTKELNPILPDIFKNQLILILGGVATGKTTLLTNLLYSDEYYNEFIGCKIHAKHIKS